MNLGSDLARFKADFCSLKNRSFQWGGKFYPGYPRKRLILDNYTMKEKNRENKELCNSRAGDLSGILIY